MDSLAAFFIFFFTHSRLKIHIQPRLAAKTMAAEKLHKLKLGTSTKCQELKKAILFNRNVKKPLATRISTICFYN